MCGIVGLVAKQPINQILFDALTALQHRGQDAAGIVTCDNGKLHLHKGKGLVRDVFRTRHIFRLKGNMGIGHVRYPTAGRDSDVEEAQPFYVNSPYGITLAHNGNLTNAAQLEQELLIQDLRHLNTHSDSEVLLNVLAAAIQDLKKVELEPDDIFQAIKVVNQRCHGAYAVVAMITGKGLLAFRDPYGIRPLVVGQRKMADGVETMVASESVALDILGFEKIADVAPGQAIYITPDGKMHSHQCTAPKAHAPCLFEFVYMARPDSIIDKISVYKVRLRLGECLAEKIQRDYPNLDIDVVMPIPDTSRTAASQLARALNVKFREGFVKNRYIGRTFIMPGQTERRKSVRQKLNTISLEFSNKNVLLVDDSIVRGTTSKEIVQMARDAGARKVYFASAAPKVAYPNVYGIDMPAASELIAHNKSTAQVCQLIGADELIYQDFQVLVDAAREGDPGITRFEDSVFTGDYITGDVDDAYLQQLEQRRNDAAKTAHRSDA